MTAIPVLPSSQRPSSRAVTWCFVVVTVLVAAYIWSVLLDPAGEAPQWRWWQAEYASMELVAASLALCCARQPGLRARTATAWKQMATGMLLLGISAMINVVDPMDIWPLPVYEVAWLASYPFLILALLGFADRPLTRHERRQTIIDAALLTICVSVLLWYLGATSIHAGLSPQLSGFSWFFTALLIGDVLLLQAVSIAAIRAADHLRPDAALAMLATFVVASLADVIFVVQRTAMEGTFVLLGAANVLYAVSAWLLALAAWFTVRGAAASASAVSLAPRKLGAAFAWLPLVATSLVGLVGLYEGAQIGNAVFRIVAIGIVVLAVLLALRLWLALRQNAALVAEQLQQVVERREAQKLEAVGRLAGGMAHEFNNLLTVMQQATDALLARNANDADARDAAGAARRAGELTRQLLTFSRRGASVGVADAAGTVKAVRPLLQRLVRDDITLDVATAPSVGHVGIDSASLEQVLLNLVRNAVDAISGSGWITIRVEPSPRAEFVRLTVADTGSGMSEEVRERLFEPFFTTKPAGQGTGLGLAIVHGLVTGAGGTLAVTPNEGRGSRFIIDLPSVPPPPVEPALAVVASPAVLDARLVVLVVDDDASVRRSLRRTLERLGHQVREAADGADAIAMLDDLPDVALVLTDTLMPRVDGWELIREVRERRPGLPIIRMSGFADPPGDTSDEAADAFLAKPFDISVLRETVVRLSTSVAARE